MKQAGRAVKKIISFCLFNTKISLVVFVESAVDNQEDSSLPSPHPHFYCNYKGCSVSAKNHSMHKSWALTFADP